MAALAGLLLAACGAGADFLYQFDFDYQQALATEPGWTSILQSDAGTVGLGQYTTALGYGWQDTTNLKARNRGSGTALLRDFHFSPEAKTFLVDLAAGTYEITMYFRDAGYAHDNIQVAAEGVQKLADVDCAAGATVVETFQTQVADGQLNLTISDAGGSDANWVLDGVQIARVPEPATAALLALGVAAAWLRRRGRR